MKSEKHTHIKEEERKFLIHEFSKSDNWDREFLIYQWFENSLGQNEKKYKLIFDLLNFTVRYVAVTKYRTTFTASDKKIEYFDVCQFEIEDFISVPFVQKRRSIKADMHLDKFIHSNRRCDFLLELENELPSTEELSSNGLVLKEEVSHLDVYRNINMCIPFHQSHAQFLQELLLLFRP